MIKNSLTCISNFKIFFGAYTPVIKGRWGEGIWEEGRGGDERGGEGVRWDGLNPPKKQILFMVLLPAY
jgi:hypothetical protein